MPEFTRADLAFNDYAWSTTEGDSPKVTGFPDNALLNRHEGYEVVNFIDKFIASQVSWKDLQPAQKKDAGRKIEQLIKSHLPGDVRSHSRVQQWIINNWNTTFLA